MLFVDLKIMGSIEFIENKRLLVLPYDVQKTEKELKHSNLDIIYACGKHRSTENTFLVMYCVAFEKIHD